MASEYVLELKEITKTDSLLQIENKTIYFIIQRRKKNENNTKD